MYMRGLVVLFFLMIMAGEVNAGGPVWQRLSYGKIPDNPVPGGEQNTFVCRDLNGVPGRLVNGKCYATWDGKEYSVDHYEGLSIEPGTYRWEWYNGFLPEGAVHGGSQGTGKDVYICRSPKPEEYTGNLTLGAAFGSLGKASKISRNGKFAPWTSTCYIGSNGYEVKTKKFLVLVNKPPVNQPETVIAGAKLVGNKDDQTGAVLSIGSAPLLGGTMMTGKAVGIVTGTLLPIVDDTTVATLARSSNTLPRPIESQMAGAGESISGLTFVSVEGGKANLLLSYEYSADRTQPVYAGAFVYDRTGGAVDVGYLPVAAPDHQGNIEISLMFPDSDVEARYIVAFLMESGQQPFMNEHFDFAYDWRNGQLVASGAAAVPADPGVPSRSDLCGAYASRAVELYALARKRNLPRILPPVWSDDYSSHYQWCLGAGEQEIYQGHQLRVGYLEQMLPGEFSGTSVTLPGEVPALDPGRGP